MTFDVSEHTVYGIVSSVWTYTFKCALVQLQLPSSFVPSISPSMTRTLLQQDFLASSLVSHKDFVEVSKTYPLHLPHNTISTDHEEEWRKGLEELVGV